MKGMLKKLKDPFNVAEIQMRIFVEQEKRWAKSWPSALRKLERDFPPGFVADEINAFLQEGIMPEYPQIFDICQRMEYCRKLQAEIEAKKTEIRAKKKARANKKRGRLTTNQRARLIK